MSFKVLFGFAAGLSQSVEVPVGSCERIIACVNKTETALGIVREEYNWGVCWNRRGLVKRAAELSDDEYCAVVEEHNAGVRWFFDLLATCGASPPENSESLTPDKAQEFWVGLELLEVPVERWSKDYYYARMKAIYECLRRGAGEEFVLDADVLTERQAASVINLLSPWLDGGDIRLDVIAGDDELSSSYHGEHAWCCGCGAVAPEDIEVDEDLCFACVVKAKEKAGADVDGD